jgi:predicted alpha/beta superfamily hydrolase
MKKLPVIALILTLILSACGNNTDDSNTHNTASTALTNTMTQNERDKTSIGELSILDRELSGMPAETVYYDDYINFAVKNTDEFTAELDRINYKEYFEEQKPFPEFSSYDEFLESFTETFDGTTTMGIALPNPDPKNPAPRDENGFLITEDIFYPWEFNRTEIESIKGSTREITAYDEEMGLTFVVMVTLPPDFDDNKTYPALVMTDGVWNFGNAHYKLFNMMQSGETDDKILVSIGYDYVFNGADEFIRYDIFVEQQAAVLDFITNNLMPYLGESFNMDFADVALLGSSLGGVFTHYALFNSDKYENQPFSKYIIASPVLWRYDADIYDFNVTNSFGYFDRNKTLDKEVFICVGSDEDAEFIKTYGNDIFGGFDSTITGANALYERLEAQGANAEYKVYEDKGHSYYFSDLLLTLFTR